VVELFRDFLDVTQHVGKQAEVRLEAPGGDGPGEAAQAAQHGRQGAVFVMDDVE
jgi:hypothetical protein